MCISDFVITLRKVSNVHIIDGFKGWAKVILHDGWKCTFKCVPSVCFIYRPNSADAILGACDVEGNFLVIKVRFFFFFFI